LSSKNLVSFLEKKWEDFIFSDSYKKQKGTINLRESRWLKNLSKPWVTRKASIPVGLLFGL